MGYNTIALDTAITGKVPGEIRNQIPDPLPFDTASNLHILRRCTLHLSDPSQNHRLSSLASAYDVLALRPTCEKSLMQACQALECDLISLDLSTRFPFHFKHTTLASALQRGVRFEICYAPGILNLDGGGSRRNLISNATQLIRATRGRGLVMSSEARSVLACRAPADVINMAVLWGLGQERGAEAVGTAARSVVVQAQMRRRSFRGVVDVVYGGEQVERSTGKDKPEKGIQGKGKRKADDLKTQGADETLSNQPISKRAQKKQAKKARIEGIQMHKGMDDSEKKPTSSDPVLPNSTTSEEAA